MSDDDDSFVTTEQDTSGDDSYVEETTTGRGSRIGESLKGILFGIILTICASILLFWNEGRSIKTTRALNEASSVLVALSTPDVDPANDRKLVYVSGDATTTETLDDKSFSISAKALRLRRTVEIYQWRENQHTETFKDAGGSTTKRTTYTYEKVWSDHIINSA
jgi:hypothetical protein